jgi:hypothetical protein
MAALSKKLRSVGEGALAFYCPGCKQVHQIQYGAGPGPRWTWDGDVERPTFTPSVLVRGVREDMTDEEWAEYDAEYRRVGRAVLEGKFGTTCHTYITAGRIQFLGDCTHALAGQTVDLPDLDP